MVSYIFPLNHILTEKWLVIYFLVKQRYRLNYEIQIVESLYPLFLIVWNDLNDYLTWINFRVDKFSRMPTSKNFMWINFREWPGLKNFAWIYFREDREFEKYFSLKKRKTTLLSIKSFYKSSNNYKYVNNVYMFDGVWSMSASKALRSSSRTYSSSLSESYRSLTSFFPLFKICEKGEEEGQNWENLKACTFWITRYQLNF